MEKRTIPIHQNSRLRRFFNPIQDHPISRVDFSVAVHLIAEDIGDHKQSRCDVVTNPRQTGFVNFKNSDRTTRRTFCVQKSSRNP